MKTIAAVPIALGFVSAASQAKPILCLSVSGQKEQL